MRLTICRIMLAAVAIMLFSSLTVSAKNYVSWAGGFHVEIPEDWEQIDYQTVDAFLISNQAGRDVLNYDAVFAPSASVPFFVGSYLIVTVDTAGHLSQTQIDSVLAVMSATFGQNVKYYPVADFMSDMRSNTPSYDAEQKLATVVNDIVHQDQITKKLMLMTKFYEDGVAAFYFYSPDSLFEQSKLVVSQMVQTFSTSDLEAAAGKAEVQVADVDVDKDAGSGDDDSSISTTVWVPFMGIVVVLIAIIAGKKKKAREKQQESTSK
ncbi:MAG: hypothetical protein OEV49_13870 [candidate division Zixibacteria bacterium]|nr:hypothetical protein [candidate division Zixibacteria bacterium]MDH3938601.1 hypothetical protein [candidate division Zixibacteria bacterium]MDH4033900.1 hypothetical protein [candidate division Zixibacteria bacterium]